jgi:hypothetical protein
VKDTRVAIQEVATKVDHLTCSWFSNFITVDHVGLTSLPVNELRKDLQKWIAPPDPTLNLRTASGFHHEGSAEWCTKGITVANWKKSCSLLWIHGKRKYPTIVFVLSATNDTRTHSWFWEEYSQVRCSAPTTCIPIEFIQSTSSVIIRDIKAMSNDGSAFLAYFYFDFKDTEKQDLRALLSSLLVQLSDQSNRCFDILFSLYSAHKKAAEAPTNDSLVECLKDMLTMTGRVPIYLVMDGLDECPNDSGIPSSREKVLEFVKELVELHVPNLRICTTSRPEFDIRATLDPLTTQQVSLHDESGQKQDIIDYVTSVVHSDNKMKKWRDVEKNMVVEKLSEKADGM